MRIAVKIAGFSMAKADTLRKAMGKKKQEIIDREGENFIRGAIDKGFPKDKVRQLWEQIVPFAKYGFNKSHSVAYAHVAYLTAYLKTHFQAHFMAAMLTSEASNTDKLAQYLGQCRQNGLEVLSPDVNASRAEFTVEGDAIRYGLAAVKGVGMAAVEPLVETRQRESGFASVTHCLRSLPSRAVNQKVLECLTKAGAFDRFNLARKGLLDHLDRLIDLTSREREQRELGQGFLFDDLPSEDLEGELASAAEADAAERLRWEREVLGFYMSGHPLDRVAAELKRLTDCSVAELPQRFADGAERATVGGLVTSLKAMSIKRDGRNQGRRMATFMLEDASGSVRVVVFPDLFERCERLLEDDAAIVVEATLKGDGDHVELSAEDLHGLEAFENRRASALCIDLDLDRIDQECLEELRELLLEHPGSLPVRFELTRTGQFRARLVPPPALSVDASTELRGAVVELVSGASCRLEFSTSGGAAPSGPVPIDGHDESAPMWLN